MSQRYDITFGGDPRAIAMLNFIKSLPDGLIVVMAVLGTAHKCHTECRTAMALVGGSGIGNGVRLRFSYYTH